VHLDAALFARIRELHENREALDLDAEQSRLLERYHSRFTRAGAELDPAAATRLRELNEQLAADSAEFIRNVQTATGAAALVVDTADELDGLSEAALAAARENAERLGHAGKFALSLKNFSNQPDLAFLRNREVRRRLLETSLERGFDSNGPLAVRMAVLRAERAALLGHPHHAAYSVEDQTARTAEAVEERFALLVPPAVANAAREAEALTAALRADLGEDAELAAWDWKYYAEKVRQAQYAVDAEQLRPYFELDRVLHDGVFHAAGQVYGLSFSERTDLTPYHPEARVFEVADADGETLGLFLADFHARPSKRGGAWMNALVGQSKLLGTKPVVVNNLNIAKPAPGEPVLLSFDEVRTMFHEFGHALHGLFSDVTYPFFAGTAVPRDFVEFPSQVNEMWMVWPEVLANYARHHITGEQLPAELVERMLEAERFGEGFRTVEYLGAAVLDWAWHRLPAGTEPGDAAEFEAAALREAGLALEVIPPRYRTGYFSHIFANGYSAGYYSYIWSEVLDADTVDWFTENGGMRRENGEAFRSSLLSRGGSTDPLEAFAAFRGRAAEIGPLLRRRGL
jgi:peptidyl-dipeptidase Dcp